MPQPAGNPLDARAPQEEAGGGNLRRYLAAVLRYKWLIAVATALGLGGGIVAVRLLPKQYAAQATIWVSSSSAVNEDRGPIQQGELLASTAWVDLLKTYTVLDEVVRQLRLYVSQKDLRDTVVFASFGLADQFVPGDYELRREGNTLVLNRAGVEISRATAGDSLGRELGFRWVPPADRVPTDRAVEFTLVTPREAAIRLANALGVRVTDREGNFLRLDLIGGNPDRVAQTLNLTLDRFVEVAADLKRQKLTEYAQILQEQLQTAERNVRAADNALEEFRVRTITLPQDRGTPVAAGIQRTQDPVFTSFFNMQIDRDQVRRDRDALQRALADSVLSPDAFVVIGAVANSTDLKNALTELTQKTADLRSLQYRYTNDNPQVQRVQEETRQLQDSTIPRLARGLIAELNAREQDYDRRISSATSELRQIPTRMIEETRRERDVDIASRIYSDLQQRYEEARLAEASSIPDVRILDRAVPPQDPTGNLTPRLLLAGLLGGVGLGLGLAILLDRFDRRVRYPEQISDELGLPILGAIPHVRAGRSNGHRAGGVPSEAAGPVIEAIRAIRLGIVYAHGTAGPVVVTVSSPGPGDGKSFLSANLALAFADSGHSTLLIDGDMRRGALHRQFELTRRPGLSDFLAGKADRAQVIRPTHHSALELIASGTRMQEGPELLASGTFQQFVLQMRSRYSAIIVDSPPLGAGVDPLILGTATGNLVLVMRTGVTDRELAGAKLEVLDRLPIRVLGAVLNDVSPTGQYRYYAYQYYTPGYEARSEDDEVDEDAPKALPRA